MYIQPETLDLIRSRVVIQDVIRRYVPSLKKKGKNYLGLCPFHKEKTPSFTVSPDKQIFYCFGCHTGGNIFNFIGKMERLEFPESVRFVADMVGVEIRDEKRGDTSLNEALYRLNNLAMGQFRSCITSPAGRKGMAYITSRGITPESIERFGIGYAPDSWDFLSRTIIKSKRDAELAESIGLIRKSPNRPNSYYDNFRNRVMFPIWDISGNVIAFGGRTIGDDTRKYINSSESPIFRKRSMLYGLNRARDSIKDLDRAIVVEGYLDVIGCHQAGLENVVAPLGTAITDEQIKMLGHYCNEIIFMYDADTAGMKAAMRSLDITEDTNINVRVGMLPEDDPFDYIMKKGPREFIAVVDRAVSPVDFRIDRIMDNFQVLGRVNTLLNLFSVIRELKLETERSVYLKKISTLLDVDENSVRADFKNYLMKQQPQKNENTQIVKNEQSDIVTRSYRDITRLVCQSPKLIEKVVIDYPIIDIPDAISREILKKISELYYNDPEFTIDKIFDFFQNGREMDFLNEIVNAEHSVINPDAAYTEIYINMKVREIDDKIDKYHAMLKSSAGANANMYLTEIEVLRREKEKMLHYVYNKVS
ncbi:MAG TPA: DNA primase [Spirochaetota bacterium]|nr:DNA primase [Spirochaetota bacterium]HOD14183.1 DNA primase [Spirochaetota bacterium]HPG51199.1 DNA primase [Spirochaetota bacterium]HQL82936.1 DNA primase [Spirochaetota bacterium]